MQNNFGLDGDEFTFNNLNRMMKITAKIAKNVVDILIVFSLPYKTLNFTTVQHTNSIFTNALSVSTTMFMF